MLNNVKKLRIESYSKPGLEAKDKTGEMYVQLNPSSYSTDFKIEYDKKQAPGTSGKPVKFNKINQQKMDFELLFDDTGAVGPQVSPTVGVDVHLNMLKALCLDYDGKQHRPRYLKLSWGNLIFKGCLESLSINYKLFNKEGVPTRAVAKTTFIEFMRTDWMVKKQNDQSPDVTHLRTVKAGDTLPLLCYEIYGNSQYYQAVAEANNLYNYRELPPGLELRFPPITR